MHAPRSARIPSYRHHKASGQAVVTLGGRDIYLGPHGTDESRELYNRTIADWLGRNRTATGRETEQVAAARAQQAAATLTAQAGTAPAGLTVAELGLAFLQWAENRFGAASHRECELAHWKRIVRTLRVHFGTLPVAEFGPAKLKLIRGVFERGEMPKADGSKPDKPRPQARRFVNANIQRVRRIFRFGVESELVPAGVWHALQAVEGIRRGTAGVKEGRISQPADGEAVAAILPKLSPDIRAIIELLWLTGARSGEIAAMRTGDIDTRGDVWKYRVREHKTARFGAERVIPLGPRAQAIVKPLMRAELEAFVFSPKRTVEERSAAALAARPARGVHRIKSRRKAAERRKRTWREKYAPEVILHAVRRALEDVNAERIADGLEPFRRFTVHEIRHAAATRIREQFGLDFAQGALGHKSLAASQIYAKLAETKAVEVARKIG